MTTSQVHIQFVSEPMGEKLVSALAGIGTILGIRLSAEGFDKAYLVYAMFLSVKKDPKQFKYWLQQTCGANTKQQNDCFLCLYEYAASHL